MTLDNSADRSAHDEDFPSGEWVGFYQQNGTRHRMEMCLTFRGGLISGAGGDGLADFTIRGRYDVVSREVTFVKHYLGAHDVFYRGFRELRGIWGVWEFMGSNVRSGFHIWPQGESDFDELAIEEAIEVDDWAVVGQPR